MKGGSGKDIFVLDQSIRASGKFDVVTDFDTIDGGGRYDEVRIDTPNGNETTPNAVLNAAKLSFTRAHVDTGTTTNDSNSLDVVITYLGADGVAGGTGDNTDYILMVIEDSNMLAMGNVDIV